jgi:hypothetical protein
MITYRSNNGRLGEQISFLYGVFSFCLNNHISFRNIYCDLNYKSESLLNDNSDSEYVFKNNIEMFHNIRYIFKHNHKKLNQFKYINLKCCVDISTMYDFYKCTEYSESDNLCFYNYWCFDDYILKNNWNFNYKLLEYICRPIHVVKKLKKKYKNIISNSIGIHVRRGDFCYCEKKNLLKDYIYNNLNWYFINKNLLSVESIIKCIENNKKKNILIFSDDVEWCINKFNNFKNVTIIQNNKPYEDLILLSLCDKIICTKGSFFSRVALLLNNCKLS